MINRQNQHVVSDAVLGAYFTSEHRGEILELAMNGRVFLVSQPSNLLAATKSCCLIHLFTNECFITSEPFFPKDSSFYTASSSASKYQITSN